MTTNEILFVLNSAAHLHRQDWQWHPLVYGDQIVGGCFTPKDTPFSTSYSHFEEARDRRKVRTRKYNTIRFRLAF